MRAVPGLRPSGPATRAELDDTSFARIAELAHREAGLALTPAKAAMVQTRLARRLRRLGLGTYPQYCDLVESPEGRDELGELVSALTTNVSHFFREIHHFETLRDEVAPELGARLADGAAVRIWSAGCSNGQEPYSIAMTLSEAGLTRTAGDLRILATDIDPKVLGFACEGRFPDDMVAGLPDPLRARYFRAAGSVDAAIWEAGPALKQLIAFRQLNLLHPWPMRTRFDAIFCRNTVIYFDEATQMALWPRFAESLVPGGWLFLGHSERIAGPHEQAFRPIGMTTYRRRADAITGQAPEGTSHGPA